MNDSTADNSTPPPAPDNLDDAWPTFTELADLKLADHHRENLRTSGLTDETIDLSGIVSAKSERLHQLGFKEMGLIKSAMVMPYPFCSGIYRIRPDEPVGDAKYLTPSGRPNSLYITPPASAAAQDPGQPLLIAEGEKKALAGYQLGHRAVGVPGVYGWRSADTGVIEAFDHFKWRCRPVTIAYDNDVWSNPDVREALRRLAAELGRRGAHVLIALLPEADHKLGLDDLLVEQGEQAVHDIIAAAAPLHEQALRLVRQNLPGEELEQIHEWLIRIGGGLQAQRPDFIEQFRLRYRTVGLRPLTASVLNTAMKKVEAQVERGETADDSGELNSYQIATKYIASKHSNEQRDRLLLLVDGCFYRYDKGVYRPMSDAALHRRVVAWLQDRFDDANKQLADAIVLNLRSMVALRDGTEPPHWLNKSLDCPDSPDYTTDRVPKVPLVLKGGIFLYDPLGKAHFQNPHTPRLFETRMWGASEGPSLGEVPRAPTEWLRFLDEVLGGDEQLIARLQEWFGAHIVQDLHLEKFALMVGDGANGKSVILRVLREMLGPDNVASVPLGRLGERFQTARLHHKLANIVTDLEDVNRSDEGILKQLVSREPVPGERKYEPPFEFIPCALHTFAANLFPRIRDHTDGFWRRLLLFPFGYQVPVGQRDPDLADQLIGTELDAIFAWAVEGAVRLRQNDGRFTSSEAADQAVREARRDCNSVATFVQEECEVGEDLEVAKDRLYGRYREWCEASGFYAVNKANFARELKARHNIVGQRPRDPNGTRQQMFVGIRMQFPPTAPGAPRPPMGRFQ